MFVYKFKKFANDTFFFFRPQYITYLLGMLIEIDSMLNCTLRYGINLFSRNSNNNVVEINHLYYMSRMR